MTDIINFYSISEARISQQQEQCLDQYLGEFLSEEEFFQSTGQLKLQKEKLNNLYSLSEEDSHLSEGEEIDSAEVQTAESIKERLQRILDERKQ